MRRVLGLVLFGCGLAVWALGGSGSAGVYGRQKEDRKGVLVTIDGLQSRAPAGWVEEDSTNKFRVKQFRLPAVRDDKENAEVVVFHFGEGSGGSAADNIKRWKSQFIPPEGKKIDDVAKTEKKKIHGVPATYFEVRGTYLFKERPFDPNSETSRRPNYRMIKVYFESKKGPYFFSLIGPADTVENYKKGFDEWVEGFK